MNYQTIISPTALAENLHSPNWMILDLRGGVGGDSKGYQVFKESHIPNAFYCSFCENYTPSKFDDKRSGNAPISASDPETLIATLAEIGFTQDCQIVIYDKDIDTFSLSNSIWLLLRSSVCKNVAVLQGGFSEWKKQNLPLSKSEEAA